MKVTKSRKLKKDCCRCGHPIKKNEFYYSTNKKTMSHCNCDNKTSNKPIAKISVKNEEDKQLVFVDGQWSKPLTDANITNVNEVELINVWDGGGIVFIAGQKYEFGCRLDKQMARGVMDNRHRNWKRRRPRY